ELENRGRMEEAMAEYLKAAELSLDNTLFLNHAAWRLATCPEPKLRKGSRALELAKKAVELMPQEPHCWNTLGVAEYRARNWKAAIEALKKAEDLDPGRYFAWNAIFLAMAHWQLGEQGQAREEYEQAVEWMQTKEPKNEELRRFRAEAEELMSA